MVVVGSALERSGDAGRHGGRAGFKVALNSIISWEPEAGVALGFNILTPSLTRLEILPCVAIGKY